MIRFVLCALALLIVCATPGVAAPPAAEHRFFGLLQTSRGASMSLRLRGGRVLAVDATQAYVLKRVSGPLFMNKPTVVEGTFTATGVLQATIVKRAAPNVQSWGLDR